MGHEHSPSIKVVKAGSVAAGDSGLFFLRYIRQDIVEDLPKHSISRYQA